MTAIVTKRESGRALRRKDRTPMACDQRPASVPHEIASAILIQHQRHKLALDGALLFSQVGEVYAAFDGDAEIVAESIRGDLLCRECAGFCVRICPVPKEAIDSVLECLLESGHHVALATAFEDADPKTGIAGTVVVRNWKSDDRSDDAGEIGRKVAAEIASLSEANQLVALRMVRRFKEILANGDEGRDSPPSLRLLGCMEADHREPCGSKGA